MRKFNPTKTKYVKLVNTALSVFCHEKKAAAPLPVRDAENILVIDFGMIGDIVMSVPFFKTLRKNAPQAEITLVCASWAKAVLQGQGLVDRFLVMDPKALRTPVEICKKGRQLIQALGQANRRHYDIALEPRGDLRYILFMHYCKAARKAAYTYTGGECLLTDPVLPPQKALHLAEERLYFAKQIGCRVYREDRYPKLALSAKQREENEAYKISQGFAGKTVIGIHPGASLKVKQWDGFRELAAMLGAASDNWAFLVFEGPGESREAAQVAKAAGAGKAQVVISKTGIAQYMQRLAICDALICNDSGAGHLARAYGVPVYVVFGPVEPAFARPYAKDGVYVFSDGSLACKPCFLTECPRNHECLEHVSPYEVYQKFISGHPAGTD